MRLFKPGRGTEYSWPGETWTRRRGNNRRAWPTHAEGSRLAAFWVQTRKEKHRLRSNMAAKIPEVRLNQHQLTSKSRMYITKKGELTKNKVETMTYEDFVATFDSGSTESRNRPKFGVQEFAHVFNTTRPMLQELQAQKLLGDGFAGLLAQIDAHSAALETLDGAKGVAASKAEVEAATHEVLAWLNGKASSKRWRAMIMALMRLGEVSRHVAQQLAEWTSAAADPQAFHAAIGNQDAQPQAALLKKADSLKGLGKWLSACLAPANASSAAGSRGGVVFGEFSEDEAD